MTEEQKQARLAEIRKASKRVQYSVTIAFALFILAVGIRGQGTFITIRPTLPCTAKA